MVPVVSAWFFARGKDYSYGFVFGAFGKTIGGRATGSLYECFVERVGLGRVFKACGRATQTKELRVAFQRSSGPQLRYVV